MQCASCTNRNTTIASLARLADGCRDATIIGAALREIYRDKYHGGSRAFQRREYRKFVRLAKLAGDANQAATTRMLDALKVS